jgi:plastocyanin
VPKPFLAAAGAPARLAPLARLALTSALGLLLLPIPGLLVAAQAASGEEIHGRIELLAKGGKGPARGSDVQQGVVYFEPRSGAGKALRAPEKAFQLVTHQKEFVPRVLAVPVGSRVAFPNQDPILHNVFSLSPGNSFDLGIYRDAQTKEKRFDQPGLVRIFCNVHHGMVAYILVLATPYYTSPAADGTFTLSGLPKGHGRLTVWHEQADAWTADLTLPAGPAPLSPRLEVVRPQVPPHLNKSGESYYRSDRDRYDGR